MEIEQAISLQPLLLGVAAPQITVNNPAPCPNPYCQMVFTDKAAFDQHLLFDCDADRSPEPSARDDPRVAENALVPVGVSLGMQVTADRPAPCPHPHCRMIFTDYEAFKQHMLFDCDANESPEPFVNGDAHVAVNVLESEETPMSNITTSLASLDVEQTPAIHTISPAERAPASISDTFSNTSQIDAMPVPEANRALGPTLIVRSGSVEDTVNVQTAHPQPPTLQADPSLYEHTSEMGVIVEAEKPTFDHIPNPTSLLGMVQGPSFDVSMSPSKRQVRELLSSGTTDALVPADQHQSTHVSDDSIPPRPRGKRQAMRKVTGKKIKRLVLSADPGQSVQDKGSNKENAEVVQYGFGDRRQTPSAQQFEVEHHRDVYKSAINSDAKQNWGQDEHQPTKLQDAILNLPNLRRRREAANLRRIFEAHVMESNALSEPTAPKIEIVNDIDWEPCPPWEFVYYNDMKYSDAVPRPDRKALRGCDCDGPCDPNSKTCSCIQRQAHYYFDKEMSGFIHGQDGRLRVGYAPTIIMECNNRCGCSGDCVNRVVQNGRTVSVRLMKTAAKGWGIFAGRAIPRGTFIGVYSGELLTDAEAEERGVIYDQIGRTYLFNLDFYHLKSKKQEAEAISGLSDMPAESTEDNEMGVGQDYLYAVDAYHYGNFTRFLNHSCDPNCAIHAAYVNEADIQKPLLVLYTQRDVAEGEELCFSYYGDPENSDDDDEEHKAVAKQKTDAVFRQCLCGAKTCKGFMFS